VLVIVFNIYALYSMCCTYTWLNYLAKGQTTATNFLCLKNVHSKQCWVVLTQMLG